MSTSCDAVQEAVSAALDGEDAPDVEIHLATCERCRSFRAFSLDVRQLLRVAPADKPIPDLAPRILARVPARRRSWRPIAAAAAVGLLAGATFAGVGDDPAPVAAADLPALVVSTQPAVTTLAADLTVEAGDTTWTGTLRYRAPESLAVVLRDADGRLLASVADGDRWWQAGPRRCTPPGASPCAPDIVRAVDGRAPFAEGTPVPLELVAPVDALARADPPDVLGERDGAVGVVVTAAQVAALIEGIDPTGALRPVHPTDEADLWLDAERLFPVALTVRAGATPERVRWAAGLGLADVPGDVILAVDLGAVVVDGEVADGDFPPAPGGTEVRHDGFVEVDPGDDVPEPADLPDGFRAGRAGRDGSGTAVRTWSDGRAWLAVRRTPGAAVPDVTAVPVDLGGAGTGYASADGRGISLQAADGTYEVTGTVGHDALRRVASSLGVSGISKRVSSLEHALAVAPDLLVAGDLPGFEPPTVHVDADGEVRLRYAGAGDRHVVVVRSPATTLTPPLEPDVVAVDVRGHPGRWRAASGDLEWIEDGHVRALRSTTVALAELLAIAEDLRSP